MGKMTQQWKVKDVKQRLNVVGEGSYKDSEMIDAIYGICVDIARRAKDGHDYRNVKGELESSIGVVLLKNRREIVRWMVLSKSGTDPALGINDIRRCVENQIVGKAELFDVDQMIQIPAKGITGVVFAAAPYAAKVEAKYKKVLLDFTPSSDYVFNIIKSVVK